MSVIRADFVSGDLSVELDSLDTIMTSPELAGLPVVDSGNTARIVVNPFGEGQPPEIVVVTSHVAAAVDATILRGQFGTTARTYASGTTWFHGYIAQDLLSLDTSVASIISAPGDNVATSAGTTLNTSSTNAAGSSGALARADHKHTVSTSGTVSTSDLGDTPAAGGSTGYARTDHTHGRETASNVRADIGLTGAVGLIKQGDIDTNAVVTSKINDLAVTGAKLAANAVSLVNMANASVDTAELVDGAVTAVKLDATDDDVPWARGFLGGQDIVGTLSGLGNSVTTVATRTLTIPVGRMLVVEAGIHILPNNSNYHVYADIYVDGAKRGAVCRWKFEPDDVGGTFWFTGSAQLGGSGMQAAPSGSTSFQLRVFGDAGSDYDAPASTGSNYRPNFIRVYDVGLA